VGKIEMPKIGFHVAHEQFAPSELLQLIQAAEAASPDCGMFSDHFCPWGSAQASRDLRGRGWGSSAGNQFADGSDFAPRGSDCQRNRSGAQGRRRISPRRRRRKTAVYASGLNYAADEQSALEGAFKQWRHNVIGGEVNLGAPLVQ
jgi:hypothetical protein